MRHRVKMLETAKGCDDGLNVRNYDKGAVYEISDGLLKCFIDLGVCRLVEQPRAIETKPEPVQPVAATPVLETKPLFRRFFGGEKV